MTVAETLRKMIYSHSDEVELPHSWIEDEGKTFVFVGVEDGGAVVTAKQADALIALCEEIEEGRCLVCHVWLDEEGHRSDCAYAAFAAALEEKP